ncbi:flagellar motor protein [Arsukibacterium ikkense]|uniref:Flagellar motor protein n=1 Tax=Arsukibacterium ikkense TaxID=336831 RepID=A0A0M2V8R7_9GAMM|nr:flagellar motor protein MotB [Arsukibacterium ikkense]KKO47006.1 flagellar motor protein [Arsukibacterium ikkense]
MYRHKQQHQHVEPEQLDRWLVSYADYMTLMFALFVVLYAMSVVKDEEYSALADTLTNVFERPARQGSGVSGSGVLPQAAPQSDFSQYGSSLESAKGPELVADASTLSDVRQQHLGSPLVSLEQELTQALANLIEQGVVDIQRDENWLIIELSSGLLFASGSATATSSARTLLTEITDIINPINNFIRIRGYTDDQPINNELFSSNWELSVARATSVLRVLESLDTPSHRMAIEGFGQHYPASSNTTAEGRAANRKVVIALSRYGYMPSEPEQYEGDERQQQLQPLTQDDGSIRVIALPGGGVRITTRQDNPDALPEQQEP